LGFEGGEWGFLLCPVSDLFLMEDEVALLQGFGDEGLVFFGGVAREGVEIIVREEGMYFIFVVLQLSCTRRTTKIKYIPSSLTIISTPFRALDRALSSAVQ